MASGGFDHDRLGRVVELCERYVDEGRLPCAQVQIAHRGQVALRHTCGWADPFAEIPLRDDALFRIYSMTKPIVSVALMRLVEQGLMLLEDPVAAYIPAFADTQVWVGGSSIAPQTRPATVPMTVKHALTHTAGLTYGFHRQHPVDEMYRTHGLGDFALPEMTLAEATDVLARMPLVFEPGTSWRYSMATDLCGRLVEVVSGQPLDRHLRETILDPLGMHDTTFWVDAERLDRFTVNTYRGPGGLALLDPREGGAYASPPMLLSGGGGLVSSIDDYQRFCDMVLNDGELDGERVIGRRTLEYMGLNHLPGGATLNDLGQSTFSEAAMEGMGFGLGFSVVVDAAAQSVLCSPGEMAWGGAASTAFLVDPVEEVTMVFMTQLLPSSAYPIRRELRNTMYGAMT